jgi:hypothetical protein
MEWIFVLKPKQFILPIFFFIACSQNSGELTSQELTKIRETGQQATSQLMGSLKKALVSTIEDSGIVAAISVCNTLAPQLAEDVALGSDRITGVSRTSRKTRNKKNNPDAIDLKAIRFFEAQIEGDSLPAFYATREDQNYRYYEPILVQALCLNCHGTQETISEQVREEIRKYYPADQAVGYALGDLRGLFRVKISAEKDQL